MNRWGDEDDTQKWGDAGDPVIVAADQRTLENYCRVLSIAWFLAGAAAGNLALAVFPAFQSERMAQRAPLPPSLGIIGLLIAGGFFGIAVAMLGGKTWAVYLSLIVGWIFLGGCLVSLSLCPLIISVAIVALAHRVLWLKRLNAV